MDLETTDFLARVQIHHKIIELEAKNLNLEKKKASRLFCLFRFQVWRTQRIRNAIRPKESVKNLF